MDRLKRIVVIALASFIFSSLASFAAEQKSKYVFEQKKDSPSVAPKKWYEEDAVPEDASEPKKDSPGDAAAVFEKVSKSVVIVETLSLDGKVQGSGVAYHNNGAALNADPDKKFTYVVTNAHVVKSATSVTVLQGGKRYEADIKHIDDEFDLALLSVQGLLLPISFPESSDELRVGEKVFAIGSPLGLENSISEGIISGKREQNGVLLLQTTAPISPGSSGGGLFDAKGRLVGITAFRVVGGENLNFAVDAGRVQDIMAAWMAATYLQVFALNPQSHFLPKEMVIINSFALTRWLLLSGSLDLSIKILHLADAWDHARGNPATGDKIVRETLQILERFLSEQTAKPQSYPEKVLLVCTLVNEQLHIDKTVKIDYGKGTANGYPAEFAESEVRWTQISADNSKFRFVLNRYSGSLSVGTKDFPSAASGKCAPAGERKF